MRGCYSIDATITALAATRTLAVISNAATRCVAVLSASITSMGTNVTNQQLEAQLQRITTDGGTATSQTPSPLEVGDQASGVTYAKVNYTVEPTTYTAAKIFDHQGFASLAGYFHQPAPEERIIIPPSGFLGLKIVTATFTALDIAVKLVFQEIG